MPGAAFHLLSRHAHDAVAMAQQAPEIQRVPLERLVLTIKALGYEGTAASVCAKMIEPPDAVLIGRVSDTAARRTAPPHRTPAASLSTAAACAALATASCAC